MRKHGRNIDRKLLFAVFFFAVFVVSGVMAAEIQLNELTLESDFSRTFNMKRDQKENEAFLYLFGERISLGHWDAAREETANAHAGLKRIALAPRFRFIEEDAGKAAEEIASIYQEARTAVGVMRKKLENYYTILKDDLNDYF